MRTVRLVDLPESPDDHPGDPGTEWHPRSDKDGAWTADGLLPDLDHDEAFEHLQKPESLEQYDGLQRRWADKRSIGAAEDSDHSEPGVV